MITKNFEDYPEHRLKFFSLLRAIATHCFPALICLSSQVLFLVPCLSTTNQCWLRMLVKFCDLCSLCLILFCYVMYQQLKLVMDSIIWAFRHTERNIAETGLNLLLEMLKKFQVRSLYICSFFYEPSFIVLLYIGFPALEDFIPSP